MTDKYRNKYRIASARASFWDYGWNAAYFVTICTKDRMYYFGEIQRDGGDTVHHLSDIGKIAQKYTQILPGNPGFTITLFVMIRHFGISQNTSFGILENGMKIDFTFPN